MSDPSNYEPSPPIDEPDTGTTPERDPVTPDPYPVNDPVVEPGTHPDPDPSPEPQREPFPTPPEPIPQYPPDVTF